MRRILAGLFFVSLAFSDEMLESNLFFPPDPVRPISETKPKPMTARKEIVGKSGSKTPKNVGMANRLKVTPDKSSPKNVKTETKTDAQKKAKTAASMSKKI